MNWRSRLGDWIIDGPGLAVFLGVLAIVLALFSFWLVHGCAATHGGHWWCWV